MSDRVPAGGSAGVPVPRVVPCEQFGSGWRGLTVVAGLALAAGFFIPFDATRIAFPRVIGANTRTMSYAQKDSVPNQPLACWAKMMDNLRHTPAHLWPGYVSDLLGLLVGAAYPQAMGLLLALYSLAQLVGWQVGRRWVSRVGLAVVVAFALAGTGALVWVVRAAIRDLGGISRELIPNLVVLGLIWGFLLLLPLIVAFRAIRLGAWMYVYHGYLAMIPILGIGLLLALLGLREPEPIGTILFISAACLLALARVGEARAVSRLSWIKAILGLMLVRLHRWALPPGHCVACGYNLGGLTELRCPECGRPFEAMETAAASL